MSRKRRARLLHHMETICASVEKMRSAQAPAVFAGTIANLIRNGARIVRAPAVLPDGSPYPEMPKEIGSISAKHEGAWKQQGVAKLLRRL